MDTTLVAAVLSLLTAVIAGLILMIVKSSKTEQVKFEEGICRDVKEIREDLQYMMVQLAILKTVVYGHLPPDVESKLKKVEETYKRKRKQRDDDYKTLED